MLRRTNCKGFLGIFLIIVGIIWLMKSLSIFSPEFIYIYLSWPVFLMAIGTFLIIRNRGHLGGFLTLFIGGTFFLSRLLNISVGEIFGNFWPLVLIAVGISILLQYWRGKPQKNHYEQEIIYDENVEISSVLSKDDVPIESQELKSVKISTILSGTKINLYGAKPIRGCIIDVEVLMGGIEIFIPSHWKVRNDVSTLFGGVEESRRRSVPLEGTEQPEIIIKGSVLFGGLEIKS